MVCLYRTPLPSSGVSLPHPSMYTTPGPYPFYSPDPYSGALPMMLYPMSLPSFGDPMVPSSVAVHSGPASSSHVSHTAFPSITLHTTHHNIKLPKLSIRKFNGDLTKWVTFWDSFSSSIHSNPTLSNVDKFNYVFSVTC